MADKKINDTTIPAPPAATTNNAISIPVGVDNVNSPFVLNLEELQARIGGGTGSLTYNDDFTI